LAPGDGNYLINRALVYAKLDDYNVYILPYKEAIKDYS